MFWLYFFLLWRFWVTFTFGFFRFSIPILCIESLEWLW